MRLAMGLSFGQRIIDPVSIQMTPLSRVNIIIIIVATVHIVDRLADFPGGLCFRRRCRCRRGARNLRLRGLGNNRRVIGDIGLLQIHNFRTSRWRVTEFRHPLGICAFINLRVNDTVQRQRKRAKQNALCNIHIPAPDSCPAST